jgi:hypothetical protein
MSPIQTTTEERPLEPRAWTAIEDTERQRTRVSWGAIFAGAAVALVVSVVLNLLGFGIGAVAIDPAEAGQAQAIGIGAGIWTVLVTLVALFFGGWIAGRLSGRMRRFEGILHGLVTWSLVTLAVLWTVTTALGTIVGGAFGVVGDVAPAAAEQVQQQDVGQAQQQAEQVQPEQVAQQAQEAVGQAANITGGTAIGLSIAMILGGIAAAGGGILGTHGRRKELEEGGEALH